MPRIRHRRAIFFFRSNSELGLAQVWDLVHALREAGVWVEMQRFDGLSGIVYEDEHQVAAIPSPGRGR